MLSRCSLFLIITINNNIYTSKPLIVPKLLKMASEPVCLKFSATCAKWIITIVSRAPNWYVMSPQKHWMEKLSGGKKLWGPHNKCALQCSPARHLMLTYRSYGKKLDGWSVFECHSYSLASLETHIMILVGRKIGFASLIIYGWNYSSRYIFSYGLSLYANYLFMRISTRFY